MTNSIEIYSKYTRTLLALALVGKRENCWVEAHLDMFMLVLTGTFTDHGLLK